MCVVLVTGLLSSLQFSRGAWRLKGGSSSAVTEGDWRSEVGGGAGRRRWQLLSKRNFSLTPRTVAHFTE